MYVSVLCFIVATTKWGTRHFVIFMLFLGMANAYVMRTNMSVAIVAMVNHTALKTMSNGLEVEDNECPGVNYDNSTVTNNFS